MIPSYEEWLRLFRVWAKEKNSPNAAATQMRLALARRGVSVSGWGLRSHLVGERHDVGLTLARAVWREINGEDEA